MASSMVSSATVATINRATPAQANMVAPFTGLKSLSTFPGTRKANTDITSVASNGGRVRCMKIWPTEGLMKFETLSYLPPLNDEQLCKEVDYLLRMKWIPCLEFTKLYPYPHREHNRSPGYYDGRYWTMWKLYPYPHREHNRSPGYYDGRYWTMWKLPMFGCTDSAQVMKEVQEARTAYPNAHIRIIGFDNNRQVQCIAFIAYKPS